MREDEKRQQQMTFQAQTQEILRKQQDEIELKRKQLAEKHE